MFNAFEIFNNDKYWKLQNLLKKIDKTFKIDTNAILNDMRYRIVIAINSLKIFSNFARWKKKVFLLNTIFQTT